MTVVSQLSGAETSEQAAARELVRGWAAGSGSIGAIRDIEQGKPDAWRAAFAGLAELGIFGVAVAEEAGGAGGSIADLSAMVDEAARALVPGPIASTALATLVVEEPALLEALVKGDRVAGLALVTGVSLDEATGAASGACGYVLGAEPAGLLVLATADRWLLVDAAAAGVEIEQLTPTDFSRPLARVVLTAAPATVLSGSPRRPGSRGGPWTPRRPTPRCASSSANRSAASRRSSTCAPRCCCAPSRPR